MARNNGAYEICVKVTVDYNITVAASSLEEALKTAKETYGNDVPASLDKFDGKSWNDGSVEIYGVFKS